eukprot:TRINITY_DN3410_c1_g1_i1.p1 TRINITY_DN3410_c1_g1~~TRINITY_DN3410_c1_g1_i1.p1  ORF type:complete len:324 (+),score=39.08 TRINITY_DN3410_c1_g1_i1:77-1048(+)
MYPSKRAKKPTQTDDDANDVSLGSTPCDSDLPNEILAVIFHCLPISTLIRKICVVCKHWNSILDDDFFSSLSPVDSKFRLGDDRFASIRRLTLRQQALDHLYGRSGLVQNWRKGLQLLSVLADAGDDYAMAFYGWVLCNGVGISADRPRGTQLFQQSNHSIARCCCLLYGIGYTGVEDDENVEEDEKAGFVLLNTECDTSDPHVRYLLGECHLNGWGCPSSWTQALQYYERAGNHVGAWDSMGVMLRYGLGAEDIGLAFALYRDAAEQGYSEAQYHLGEMYQEGVGRPSDLQQAKHWYRLAAEQGHEQAQTALQQMETNCTRE